MTALFRFEQAVLGYPGRTVLVDVDFELPTQAFLGIFGHNGSGKTTLLRTALGFMPCLSGRFVATDVRYGYVPQKEKLDPIYPLSVFDVAAMGTAHRMALLDGLCRSNRDRLIRQALGVCGVAELEKRRYSELSGGQRQRVLLARALASEATVLVLDEPLAGLDITTQAALLSLFKQFKEQKRLTIVMVSHRLQLEKGLFTHIAWVEAGKVVMGEAEAMLSTPRLTQVFKAEL